MKLYKTSSILLLVSFFFTFMNYSLAQQINSRVIEDGGTGKYSAIMMTESSLPTHTIFRPKDMSVFDSKDKLSIIAWGNGGCFNSPWEHVNFLSEVSSHGYLVVAIGTMPKESGEQVRDNSKSSLLIDAIDWAITQNQDKNSIYYNRIDTSKIAVSGMSCGGLQTSTGCAGSKNQNDYRF